MNRLRKVILIFSVFGFIACALLLGNYYWNGAKEQEVFDTLSKKHPIFVEEDESNPKDSSQEAEVSSKKERNFSNRDCVGWLLINDTSIDYPVMQRKNEGEYYLHRDFYGKYSYSGTPFLDQECDLTNPKKSIVIYGHNMRNRSMFGNLRNYEAADYLKAHSVVSFETKEGVEDYEIFAVLKSRGGADVFGVLDFTELETEEGYKDFVQTLKKKALYPTDIEPKDDQQLLFLITCTNEYGMGGRLVIAACKVEK